MRHPGAPPDARGSGGGVSRRNPPDRGRSVGRGHRCERSSSDPGLRSRRRRPERTGRTRKRRARQSAALSDTLVLTTLGAMSAAAGARRLCELGGNRALVGTGPGRHRRPAGPADVLPGVPGDVLRDRGRARRARAAVRGAREASPRTRPRLRRMRRQRISGRDESRRGSSLDGRGAGAHRRRLVLDRGRGRSRSCRYANAARAGDRPLPGRRDYDGRAAIRRASDPADAGSHETSSSPGVASRSSKAGRGRSERASLICGFASRRSPLIHQRPRKGRSGQTRPPARARRASGTPPPPPPSDRDGSTRCRALRGSKREFGSRRLAFSSATVACAAPPAAQMRATLLKEVIRLGHT